MALEAQEVAVRLKLFGGAAFKAEADGSAASLDKIGAAGKRASGNVGRSTAASTSLLSNMGTKASRVGSQMIGFGRTMSMAGLPIAALGYYAVKSSSQFGQAMTLLSTQAGMPIKTIGKVSRAVQDMAPKVGAIPLALAQALYPIESIGLRGKKALVALRAAAMGSAVGLDSLENTADAVTTVIASHIKGAGGPVEAMSIMDKAIGLGKMHLSDLTESFKSAIIPISQQFGLSFRQILAAASGLTRVGIPANQVMARMRLTLTSMVAPTTAGAKAIAALGLAPNQLADDLHKPKGLLSALDDIKTKAAALGNRDLANTYIAQMFGKSRGMASIGSLLEQLPQIESIYGKVMGTTPQTLDTHFKQTEATAAFKYKQIQANFYNAMVKLGDALNKVLLPLLVQLVPHLTAAVKWFGQLSPGVQKFLVLLLAASVVGGPILMFTGAIVKVGGLLLGAFSTAIGAVSGEAGLSGLLLVVGKATTGFVALVPELLAAAVAVGILYKLKNPIEKAGKKFGKDTLAPTIANTAKFFGITGPANYLQAGHYLHSAAFEHLRPDQRAAIEWRLLHPNAPLTGRNALLAGRSGIGGGDILHGINLPNLPGLNLGYAGMTRTPRVAASSGSGGPDITGAIAKLGNFIFKGEFTANTFLDGKQIATSVNHMNRKAQNRR